MYLLRTFSRFILVIFIFRKFECFLYSIVFVLPIGKLYSELIWSWHQMPQSNCIHFTLINLFVPLWHFSYNVGSLIWFYPHLSLMLYMYAWMNGVVHNKHRHKRNRISICILLFCVDLVKRREETVNVSIICLSLG